MSALDYTIYSSLIRTASDKCCDGGRNYDDTVLGCYVSKIEALFNRYEMTYEANYIAVDSHTYEELAETNDEALNHDNVVSGDSTRHPEYTNEDMPLAQELVYDTTDVIPIGFREVLDAVMTYRQYAYLLDLQSDSSFPSIWLHSVLEKYTQSSKYDILEVEDMLLVRLDDIGDYNTIKDECYRQLEMLYRWYIPDTIRLLMPDLPATSPNEDLELVSGIIPLLFDKKTSMDVIISILVKEPLTLRFSRDEVLQRMFCLRYPVLSYFDGAFCLLVDSYTQLLELQRYVNTLLSQNSSVRNISIELEYDIIEQAEFAAQEINGVVHTHLREMRPYRVLGTIDISQIEELPTIVSTLKKR